MGKEVISNSTIQLIRRQLREKVLSYAGQMDNDAAVQRAVDEVMEQMRRLGPQQGHLQETLDAIWEKQRQENEALEPPALDGNADEQQKRLEYAEQCRRALFQALKASAMRSLAFQDTVESCFKPGELKGEVSDHGWMQELLWLAAPEASQEDVQWCRQRNEVVVLAAAMSQDAITPQVFEDRYLKWLTEEEGPEKARGTFGDALRRTPSDLRKVFFAAVGVEDYMFSDVQSTYERFQRGELRGSRDEVDKAYGALVKCVAVEALYSSLNTMSSMSDSNRYDAKSAAARLIAGNVGAEELEEVYASIIGKDGALQTAQSYSYALSDLMEMGFEIPQEIVAVEYPENEEREAAAAYFETVAAQYANPYYALLTGEDLKKGKLESLAPQEDRGAEPSWLDSYVQDQLRAEENENAMTAAQAAKRFLGAIRLRQGKPVPLPCEDDEDLLMYRSNGRTFIFHTQQVTLANGTTATHYISLCREPGLFIDRGLTRGVAELQQRSSELPRDMLMPLPQDVARMNTALAALDGAALGSGATPGSARALMQKLDEMKKAAEAYYDEHKAEWDDEALKGEDRRIAEERLAFAGELITFAEKKAYLLSGIQEHMKELGDLGLYPQQAEEDALDEERSSVADEDDREDEEEKEDDLPDRSSSSDGGEEEKAEQKENSSAYKEKLALINEDMSIDPEEAKSVSTQMKELLEEARSNVKRENWAQSERTAGTDSKVNQHIGWWIESIMGTYRSMQYQHSAKKALAASTLKYMVNQEKGGELLGFAFEHDGLDALEALVMQSDSFRKRVEQLDLSEPNQVKDCMENLELFAKPLGDKLLHMAEKVLEEEAPLVEKQDRINMLRETEDSAARALAKSEKAAEKGDAEGVVRYGAEALAHQTTAALLRLTAGKAGDPYAVRKMVQSTDTFKEELKKLDLSKPGAVKAALDAKLGSAIAGALVQLSQKTGDDPGSRNSLHGRAVQHETAAQHGMSVQTGK